MRFFPPRSILSWISLAAAALGPIAADPVARASPVAPPAAATILNHETVVDLQPFRRVMSAAIRAADGRIGRARLFDLSPNVREWYLLEVRWREDEQPSFYHLENPRPASQRLEVDAEGLVRVEPERRVRCGLWTDLRSALETASRSGLPYAPLCEGSVYVRNPASGSKTKVEWATDFLRDYIPKGDAITSLVKRIFFQDHFLLPAHDVDLGGAGKGPPRPLRGGNAPDAARIDPAFAARAVVAQGLGLDVEGAAGRTLAVGEWYMATHAPGVFVSAIHPKAIAPELLLGHRDRVSQLDEVEGDALDYLVAFDLKKFDIAFSMGTEHPRVDWSSRASEDVRDPALPGPDGIGDVAPLVRTGLVPPWAAERVAASFTGGFRRSHGAFKWGYLSERNHGSHYGFLESGVVLSTLQPGLATLFVLEDGSVKMRTWSEADQALLPSVRHALQNGVPILERDERTGVGIPGKLVGQWALGNWSGSMDVRFRTVRAGVCLQQHPDGDFLVYGYFSSATPSAMARVFQAYSCSYAMMLDMNALEHTYLALYILQSSGLHAEHLIDGMGVLDKSAGGHELPRFIGFPDNRDFFYLLRRPS